MKTLSAFPCIMGIVNVNAQSYFVSSRVDSTTRARERVAEMVAAGAQIIDIGGQSTNPKAVAISEAEEMQNVGALLDTLAKDFPDTIFSVDTFFAAVAHRAARGGFHIINDVRASFENADMHEVLREFPHLYYVLMHEKKIRDESKVLEEVRDFFTDKLSRWHFDTHRIILDVGVGFGKIGADNFRLLKNLGALNPQKLPMLVGLSRKTFIRHAAGVDTASALAATCAAHTATLLAGGADILRVHDVQAARNVMAICKAWQAS